MGRYIKENLSKEYIMQKFEPDQLVLVRHGDGWPWRLRRYSLFDGTRHETQDGNVWYDECILPYAGNEYMLGTSNSPTPKWEPKPGELVAVKQVFDTSWRARVFVKIDVDKKYQCFCSQDENDGYASWDLCEPIRDHFIIPEE